MTVVRADPFVELFKKKAMNLQGRSYGEGIAEVKRNVIQTWAKN
jgi:hypothetical protein